jgi:hypothetical protein
MALLPTSFVEDPAGYLASIASQSPSRLAFTKLAGQVASFIASGQGVGTGGGAMVPPADSTTTTAGGVGAIRNDNSTPPISQIASLYLQAAATQLLGDVAVGDIDQEMIRAQQQYEILEVRVLLLRFVRFMRRRFSRGRVLKTCAFLEIVRSWTNAWLAALVCIFVIRLEGRQCRRDTMSFTLGHFQFRYPPHSWSPHVEQYQYCTT